jgi:hypothetical protein
MSLTLGLSSRVPRSLRVRIASPGSLALAVVASFTLLSASLRSASAQVPVEPAARWEFLMSSGATLPVGEQHRAISNGGLSTIQLSYVAHPAMAVTATMGWARSRDLAFDGDPTLDLFSYDIGAEARARGSHAGRAIAFRPFAGVGAGARTYNHRHVDLAVTHVPTAYASVGGELGGGRIRLKVEARNYVVRFKPLAGQGGADTRSEVALMAGLRLVPR